MNIFDKIFEFVFNKKYFMLFGVGLLFLLFFRLLSSDNGLLAYWQFKNILNRQAGEIVQIQEDINQLELKIILAKNKPQFLETIARKRLKMLKPDEIKIKIINTVE